MSCAISKASTPARAVPLDPDVARMVGADLGLETDCQRTPCPHCVLGIRHAARLEEVMNKWQQRVWDYSNAGTKPVEGYWMRLMACQ